MRYNFACTLVTQLQDFDAALEMLGPVFAGGISASSSTPRSIRISIASGTIRASRHAGGRGSGGVAAGGETGPA
ncbi:MAG: hypothetical protein WDM81_04225 [Rhizomicrobium sp.]